MRLPLPAREFESVCHQQGRRSFCDVGDDTSWIVSLPWILLRSAERIDADGVSEMFWTRMEFEVGGYVCTRRLGR